MVHCVIFVYCIIGFVRLSIISGSYQLSSLQQVSYEIVHCVIFVYCIIGFVRLSIISGSYQLSSLQQVSSLIIYVMCWKLAQLLFDTEFWNPNKSRCINWKPSFYSWLMKLSFATQFRLWQIHFYAKNIHIISCLEVTVHSRNIQCRIKTTSPALTMEKCHFPISDDTKKCMAGIITIRITI